MSFDYIIKPINDREVIQKNFVRLGERANNYSGRHPSLNERFSILERGYYLAPKLKEEQYRNDVVTVQVQPKESTSAFVQKLKDKANAKVPGSPSPCFSPPKSAESVSP
ncbi:unnamed protein product [Auanema sp. JU1783]|nr:unnamed protein product [Auanema sp. JU1783]